MLSSLPCDILTEMYTLLYFIKPVSGVLLKVTTWRSGQTERENYAVHNLARDFCQKLLKNLGKIRSLIYACKSRFVVQFPHIGFSLYFTWDGRHANFSVILLIPHTLNRVNQSKSRFRIFCTITRIPLCFSVRRGTKKTKLIARKRLTFITCQLASERKGVDILAVTITRKILFSALVSYTFILII